MESGEVLNSRYELVRRLADSRALEVWVGRDLSHGQEVAIKLLRRHGGLRAQADVAARFKEEAARLADVDEPHIAALYDFKSDTTSDGPVEYVVSELVRGRTLAEVTRDVLPTLPKVVALTEQILLALRAAHNRDVVHRDLNPANIVIEDSGNVKVLDFGVALLSDTAEMDDLNADVPLPAAPEQATSGPQDTGVDVYALGCVMYEMLTGTAPFGRDPEPGQLLWSTMHAVPAPPSNFRPTVPAELDKLVLRLLAKDPKHRPESVEAVLNSLRRFTPETPASPATLSADPVRSGGYYTPESLVAEAVSDAYQSMRRDLVDAASRREMDPALGSGAMLVRAEGDSLPSDPEPSVADEDAAPAAATLNDALARLFLRLGPPPESAEKETEPVGSDGGGARG
ncbi:serine/threonine-protein kinase [Streptomyces rectiverticillatus]|uniref:serine/threonine-protein kinase n=1 Tax=Streptomyces rectiverticillatus TaxID=173860 RepID=UPI001FEC9D04